ncbi:MAG: D-alanyl-D-alanine carboxypeptidase [Candidatus Wildermuthbacteria bacterium]|nr:D-alanyl-D-alanine carboxypeptidase [Candidatus Wildermuthbacteria bacterium]
MTQNLKILIAAFFLSIPLWLGLNTAYSELNRSSETLAAQILQPKLVEVLQPQTPQKQNNAEELSIQGKAALSAFVDQQGNIKILYERNATHSLPIASLTKLTNAVVTLSYASPDQKVTITKQMIQKPETFGDLKIGEELFVKDLLYSMLIESSNDAAAALASVVGGEEAFVRFMNLYASQLGLEQTFFADVAGIDPNVPDGSISRSSAMDLVKLAKFITKQYPEIFEILTISSFDLYSPDGTFHHRMKNTNELLVTNGWPTKVLGGKTGWTPIAKGSLLVVLESPASPPGGPDKKGYLVNVVLGSEDRFGEMKKLVDWVFESYVF